MMTVEGTPVQASGLDVSPHPYRPVAANGDRHRTACTCWACSSRRRSGERPSPPKRVQQAGPVYASGQRTLRDADEIARAILGA